jgi:hypothetical protein
VQATPVILHPAFLYNPGLKDSWFIVTGVFGLLLILNSSLVASGAMVKEREAGTIEQLRQRKDTIALSRWSFTSNLTAGDSSRIPSRFSRWSFSFDLTAMVSNEIDSLYC